MRSENEILKSVMKRDFFLIICLNKLKREREEIVNGENDKEDEFFLFGFNKENREGKKKLEISLNINLFRSIMRKIVCVKRKSRK